MERVGCEHVYVQIVQSTLFLSVIKSARMPYIWICNRMKHTLLIFLLRFSFRNYWTISVASLAAHPPSRILFSRMVLQLLSSFAWFDFWSALIDLHWPMQNLWSANHHPSDLSRFLLELRIWCTSACPKPCLRQSRSLKSGLQSSIHKRSTRKT